MSHGYECCCRQGLWNQSTVTTTTIPPDYPHGIVSGLYTYGAVAVHGFLDKKPGNYFHCFPGMRTYTENSGIGNYPDFAASLGTGQWHARTPVLVLKSEWGRDTCIHKKCSDVVADSSTYMQWPNQWKVPGLHVGGELTFVKIHSIVDSYTPRLDKCDKDNSDTLVRTFADVAKWAYLSCHGIRDGNWTKDWKLVAKLNITNGRGDQRRGHGWRYDSDSVVIVQNKEKDCAISFQGTSHNSEFLTSLSKSGTRFCGQNGVHYGIATELRWIFEAFGHVIKSTLRQCAQVYSVGHSLGGGIAEAFAFCANNHDLAKDSTLDDTLDYEKIGFEKDEQPTLLEEVNLTSCTGERVINKVNRQ